MTNNLRHESTTGILNAVRSSPKAYCGHGHAPQHSRLRLLILTRINKSDFCIFDDWETEYYAPDVFIELGAAIAFGHSYFHLSFNKKRTVKIGRRREEIEVPSDFAGLLRLNYSNYEDLFLQFAIKLPAFLKDRGLARSSVRRSR